MGQRSKAILFAVVACWAAGCVLPAYEIDDSLGTAGSGGTTVLPELPPKPANCNPPLPGGAPMVGIRGGYCIDQHEVTWQDYFEFIGLALNPLDGTQPPECQWNNDFAPPVKQGCEPPLIDEDKLPVVCIDWCDATAYCKAVGKRLCGKLGQGPNPAAAFADAASSQWYNACSSGGANEYPYGATFDRAACNTKETGPGQSVPGMSKASCQPSDSNYAGVFDLSGNVAEWEDSCLPGGGDGSGDNCRIRGGSFSDPEATVNCGNGATSLRNGKIDRIGFRCCLDVAGP